jgi:hypothetical protein
MLRVIISVFHLSIVVDASFNDNICFFVSKFYFLVLRERHN